MQNKAKTTPISRPEMEACRDRIKSRLIGELEKYGFSWESLVSAWKLPFNEKKLLDEKWNAYYAETGDKPFQPNPWEYREYEEFLRVESLLRDPHVQLVNEIFGIES